MSALYVDMLELGTAIRRELREYSEEVEQAMSDTINEVTKEAEAEVRKSGEYNDRTGKYRKGFKIKKKRYTGYCKNVLYNIEYNRTHLLEDGHNTMNKKRTRAFPHWEEAQRVIDTLPQRLEDKLS